MTTRFLLSWRSLLRVGVYALLAAGAGTLSAGAHCSVQAAQLSSPVLSASMISAPLASAARGSVRILWSSTPPAPRAGSPVTFSYRLIDTRSGRVLSTLPLVHERPMHLILVSRDLTHFQHIHPQATGDGMWRVRTTLEAAGTYVLFNEFVYGGQTVLDRREVTIGRPTAVAALTPDLRPTVQDGVRIALAVPARIVAGQEARFTYRLTRGGRPVTDLKPYLGAAAHVAIISRDTHTFTHTHGEAPGSGTMGGMSMGGMEMGTPPARFGPRVMVTHTFAHAGLYKIWAHFGYHSHVLIASFVVQVQDPSHHGEARRPGV